MNHVVYNLSGKDLETIKADLQVTYSGTRIIYFIDPFDVIEFAFPSLLDVYSKDALEADTASQKYLAYDALFLKHDTLPIVTKEYQLELRSLLGDVKNETHRYNQLKTRDKFLAYFLKLCEKPKLLQRRISILLVYTVGFLNFNMIERIKHLVSNPRFVLPESNDPDEQELLDDILLDTRPTSRVETVFDLFCKKEHPKLSRLTADEKDVYLENTYRDIEVIDRIFEINQKVKQVDLIKDKYLFQYLSSSPHKSPIIFKLFMDVANSSIGLNETEFDFLRNINHFFVLDSILSRNDIKSKNMQEVDDLLAIGSFYNENSSIARKLSYQYKPVVKGLQNNITTNRNSLENTYSMYKLFTTYEEKAKQAIKELQEGSKESLKEVIDSLYNYLQANRDEREKVLVALDNYGDENWIQNKMLRFLHTSGKLKGPKTIHITVYAGLDVIRTHIQLYPVLLFYRELSSTDSGLLSSLLLHVASPVSHQKDFIAHKFTQVQEHEFFTLSNFERKIFGLLLQLILPTSHEKNTSPYRNHMSDERLEKEMEIIESLERIYKVNEKRLVEYKPVTTSEGHTNRLEVFYYPPLTIKFELGYFLSWMYRRVRNYSKCKEYINECLLSDSTQEEPRLFHSRALCLISEAYENMETDETDSKEKFRQAYDDLNKAKRLFQKRPQNLLMKHIIIGIDNTICDTCVELYLLCGQDKEDLITDTARPLLNQLKESLKEINENYNYYPSYNHTEADLEYCEAVIFYKQRRIQEAKKKIANSVIRLNVVDDTMLLQGYPYLSASRKRIDKLAIRIHKNND